jgi:hypothetical protein
MGRMVKYIIIIFLVSSLKVYTQGSINNFSGDESVFYAQTKQVNQFFRRFNGEEDVEGKRFYDTDKNYRDPKTREKFLKILFDNTGYNISKDVKSTFITQVTSKKNPFYLDFHANEWFAEVSSSFIYKKERINIILYLKIEMQNSGYKWVFTNIYCDRFSRLFAHMSDTANTSLFLHPLSHETDFMNIHKVFDDPENMDYYLEKNYNPDQLSIFTGEVKNGNLKFESVNGVKFHFFQVPGWYFEVSYFNRNEKNSGWLISNMIRINEKEKNTLIRNYTHEN